MANPFGKTRDVENPYATYVGYHSDLGPIEVRILKRYKQSVEAEKKNQYSRWFAVNSWNSARRAWFTAAKSDATFGSWDYGDQYAGMIQSCYRLSDAEPEWLKQYRDAEGLV